MTPTSAKAEQRERAAAAAAAARRKFEIFRAPAATVTSQHNAQLPPSSPPPPPFVFLALLAARAPLLDDDDNDDRSKRLRIKTIRDVAAAPQHWKKASQLRGDVETARAEEALARAKVNRRRRRWRAFNKTRQLSNFVLALCPRLVKTSRNETRQAIARSTA